MNAVKILKFIITFVLSVIIGLLVSVPIISLVTGISITDFFHKLFSLKFMEVAEAGVVGALAFLASLVILVPAHELGHLVAGLLSGYKFISFRIFNIAVIKQDEKLKFKRFGVAGTLGQCLLDTPSLPIDRVPVFLYNAGGVIANILLFLLILPLIWVGMDPLLKSAVFVFLLTDVLLIIMNGIPMRLGGIGNDGYNIILLRKNKKNKMVLVAQLRSNSLIQAGVRPKNLPEDIFPDIEVIDYRNPLDVWLPLSKGGILIDGGKNREAREIYEELYSHREEILPIYAKELVCELIWLRLMTGDKDGASELLDDETKKYIESYRKVMSSKERVLCAKALILDDDRPKAETIYSDLLSRKEEYLLQGEAESDIALLTDLLNMRSK